MDNKESKIDNISDLLLHISKMVPQNKDNFIDIPRNFNFNKKYYQVSDKYIKDLIDESIMQKTDEWYTRRKTLLTASDADSILGYSQFGSQTTVLKKKIFGDTFRSNRYVFWGRMFEEPAVKCYEILTNSIVFPIGLVISKKKDYIAASPDGIVSNKYKNGTYNPNGGTLLEIKCPLSRDIGNGIPEYYKMQVQTQLYCCELKHADFFQCKFEKYNSVEDFLIDSATPQRPWLSLDNSYKGVFMIISDKVLVVEEDKYENSNFYYPDTIFMNKEEIISWLERSAIFLTKNRHTIYEVVWWKLEKYEIIPIIFDEKNFNKELKVLDKFNKALEVLKENDSIKSRLFNNDRSLLCGKGNISESILKLA